MDAFGFFVFLGIMVILAAFPSTSVGFVVIRSAGRGLGSGIAAALGIVAGDLVFVTLALLGMTTLAQSMGELFAILRVLGGAYLIWVGIGLLDTSSRSVKSTGSEGHPSLPGTFVAALFLTLGDLKAIVFYASLFPLFVTADGLSPVEIAVVIGATAATVGGVKLGYAFCANRIARRLSKAESAATFHKVAGVSMIGAGGIIIAKAY